MKKVFSKILLIVIALSMLLSCAVMLTACSDEEGGSQGDEEKLDTGDILSDLPNKKYGEDFVIICHDGGRELIRETAEGDKVDYAIYMRNRAVEERYGVNIKYKSMVYNTIPSWVSDILKANDEKSLDLVNSCIGYQSTIVTAGNAMDMMGIPYVDFSKDWWLDSTLEDLTLNGKTYMALGDMNTSSIYYTFCIYYNKVLCEKYNLPDMYELAIEKGNWTYANMIQYATGIRDDLDKDGRYDENDLFGLVLGTGGYVSAFLWSYDNPIFKREAGTDDLDFVFMENKNKISKICTDLLKLYYKTDGVFVEDSPEMFAQSKAVFQTSLFGFATDSLRQMNAEDWGVIPYPKFNAKQEEYMIPVAGSHSGMLVPKTNNEQKLEKIGVVLEALNRLSSNGEGNLVTEYYDKGLKSKYLGDPREAKAVDLIMESRMFDFGYIYLEFNSPAYWVQYMIKDKDDKIEKKYKENRPELEGVINNVYEAFGLTFDGLP